MITKIQIQKKLIEEIKNSGFKQKDLAKILSIDDSTMSRYIKGITLPSIDIVANLCKILDLDANEIFCLN